jgi:DNA-binding transcriptional ArsR family regulator
VDEQELPTVDLTDPRAIRALAHPARMAVIDELYSGRELTATECAEIAGLSPSAMSYHLRSLEKAGIVVRAENKGDGRERPYRAAGSHLRVHSGTGAGGIAATAALTETLLSSVLGQFQNWMADRGQEDPAWLESAGASNSSQIWLLPEEAEALQERMLAEVDAYRSRRTGERPPGARRVRIAMVLFPLDGPESATPAP